ncbi:MAG: carboxypeptidase regulatory-like domain-containing protein [Terriglobales bacterium]
MSSNTGCAGSVFRRSSLWVGAIAVLLVVSLAYAQDSSTGNVSGTVTGPKGASVSGADLTITNKITGLAAKTTTSPAGTYAIRDLPPGEYVLHVAAKGFEPADLLIRIQASATATGDLKLQRTVAPSAKLVDTESAEVRGSFDTAQMEQIPTDRGFLDLTRLEPGVQVLDGPVLAPSKSALSATSIVGRNGRTSRIEVDGIDVTDETVGTTTTNIPMSAIQEIEVGQSLLPLSSGLASAGVVNVTTKSATDERHGQIFGNFRDKAAGGAALPGGQDNSYSREFFGGDVGGAWKKDKLFYFLSGEYLKQDLDAPAVFNPPFDILNGSYRAPFHETEVGARLDYRLSSRAQMFYRFTYDNGSDVNAFGGSNFQPLKSRDTAYGNALGFDFTRGPYVHSIRFAYDRYSNDIVDAVAGSGIFNPAPGLSLNFTGGSGLATGPSPQAPQQTKQANLEGRYDGSKTWGAHTFRFGAAVNKIDNLISADLFGLAPQVGSDTDATSALFATAGPFAGGAGNPLNYPVDSITLGNGFSCFSEKSGFGSPCGGFGDTRMQAYGGDVWKVRSNLTMTIGVQYVRDTGRTDSDLPAIPCSAVAPSYGSQAPCTDGDLLSHFGGNSQLGGRVRQPNLNFAPQFGLAWDPGKSGRTVVRAGIGMYYDNNVFRNLLVDRVARLANGQFNAQANDPCASHGVVIFPGNIAQSAAGLCGQPIGNVATAIADLQTAFQAANATLTSSSPNPSFLGQALNSQQGLLAPNYQTPRSVQMNIGVQKQLWQTTLFSLDYVRNVGTHYLLGYDTNHVGDASHLNTNAALNAINNTLAGNALSSGCAPAASAGASSQTAVNCYLAAVPGATIADFAGNGLDSGGQFLAGAPASLFGLTPDTGAAFAGINPLVGRNTMFFPAGRSLYSGVQVGLRTHVSNPVRGVVGGTLQFSYAHSSFRSNVPGGLGDQALLPLAADFNHPTAFFGSASQDRKNQFSLGSVLDLPRGLRLGLVAQVASPLPQTLFLPSSGGVGGEIFRTDVTGDGSFGGQSQTGAGSYGDILPGTNIGSFGRAVKASNLNTIIETYNVNFGNQLTPAGAALVNAGLLSRSQLLQLGADAPAIATAPAGSVGPTWLRTFDLSLARPFHFGDRFVVEPSVSAFNVLNFANFDGPGNRLSGALNGTVGSLNGTATADRASNRTGPGSGVFTLGAPRQLQFGVKLTF